MQTISQSNTKVQRRALESRLISEARAGETSQLVEYIYSNLVGRAVQLARLTRATDGMRLEADDLIQEGIEQVLANLGQGLSRDNPVAWFLVVAWNRMARYSAEFRQCVRVPKTSQLRGRRVCVASLDEVLPGTDGLTLLDVLEA